MYDDWGYDDYDDDDYGYGASASSYAYDGSAARVSDRGVYEEKTEDDIADFDFVQHVLSWQIKELLKYLNDFASDAEALSIRYADVNSYFRSFLPYILEEARATVAEGLESLNHKQRQYFSLTLSQTLRHLPKNQGNPSKLLFQGRIPKEHEHSTTMNVLFLRHPKGNINLLALASGNPDSRELSAKVILFDGTFTHNRPLFERGQRWQAGYLGSVVTHERMYRACSREGALTVIKEIYSAQLQSVAGLEDREDSASAYGYSRFSIPSRVSQSTLPGHLNSSQRKASQSFLDRRTGVQLLQGPPGTGKTTTIVALLKALCEKRERTLVSAPSNKAVQVLAERFLRDYPDSPVVLAGVESKVPQHLRSIFLHTWRADSLSQLSKVTNILLQVQNIQPGKKQTWQSIQKSILRKLANLPNALKQVQHQVEKYDIHCGTYFNAAQVQSVLKEIERIIQEISAYDSSRQASSIYAYGSPYLPARSQSVSVSATSNEEDKSKQFCQTVSGSLIRVKANFDRIHKALSDSNKDDVEKKLLASSQVIFATLSVCGRFQMIEGIGQVDALVVDEAGQSVEAETLIALQHNPTKVLLVGDTKQLPATVISEYAEERHFGWSMMWRLAEESKQPMMMLQEQYRMHPDICRWPSNQYYEGRLVTAPHLNTKPKDGLFSSRMFYDVRGKEVSQGHSKQNEQEANYVISTIRGIRKTDQVSRIGVITFYAAQVSLLNTLIKQNNCGSHVHVSTVDGFQGDEREIIIISCVRAKPGAIGFLSDFRRLNVAITRPKNTLIILGNCQALKSVESDVKKIIMDCQAHRQLFTEQNLRDQLGMPSIVQVPPQAKKSNRGRDGKKATVVKHQTQHMGNQGGKIPAAEAAPANIVQKAGGKGKGGAAVKCRFFKPGIPGSCKKAEKCDFSHARSGEGSSNGSRGKSRK